MQAERSTWNVGYTCQRLVMLIRTLSCVRSIKPLAVAALVRGELDLDFFFGLRGSRSVLPLADCVDCACHKNWVAAQDVHFCHIPIWKHGDVQAHRASNVSIFDDCGVVGLAGPDDFPLGFVHLRHLGVRGRNGRQQEQKSQSESSECVLECAIGPTAAAKSCHLTHCPSLGACEHMTWCNK